MARSSDETYVFRRLRNRIGGGFIIAVGLFVGLDIPVATAVERPGWWTVVLVSLAAVAVGSGLVWLGKRVWSSGVSVSGPDVEVRNILRTFEVQRSEVTDLTMTRNWAGQVGRMSLRDGRSIRVGILTPSNWEGPARQEAQMRDMRIAIGLDPGHVERVKRLSPRANLWLLVSGVVVFAGVFGFVATVTDDTAMRWFYGAGFLMMTIIQFVIYRENRQDEDR